MIGTSEEIKRCRCEIKVSDPKIKGYLLAVASVSNHHNLLIKKMQIEYNTKIA